MAKGLSLHIGLNSIDPTKYEGKYEDLRNAENDARYYFDLAQKNNYSALVFTGDTATSENLLATLYDYAGRLEPGDSCFISYSGHGTRVKDLNEDEEDGYDEVLVLYDRLFIDDEFRQCWAKFQGGVKIFFINDSCYNGTVLRFFELNDKPAAVIWPDHILRGIDSSEVKKDFEKNIALYEGIKLNPADKAVCSIIHIGACQDNQLADDGASTERNGKFTSSVREVLEKDGFTGSYKNLYEKVMLKMPPWQTPHWDTEAGVPDEAFEKSKFLVI
jgi:hypothetical protein